MEVIKTKLEQLLDHELRKDTMDVVFVDEQGNNISNELHCDLYSKSEVLSVKYEMIAIIKIKRGCNEIK